tara:strand:+ start:13921 stop:14070 length:150 start_codon:yes stop_codon:yes gene_type:complete
MGDGSVRFVTDSIEAGNDSMRPAKAGEESTYGVWGALGTRNGSEGASLE